MRLHLRLYVHGDSPRSQTAIRNVQRMLARSGDLGVELELVDVCVNSSQAEADRVLATPTLIRLSPGPTRRVVGDMSDLEALGSLFDPGPGRLV